MDQFEPGPPGPPPEGDDPPERTSGLMMETCYRHPRVVTGVHCTRCGRPICPDCMTAAPVGYQCPDCVREARQSAPRQRMRVRFLIGRPGSFTTALLFVNIAVFLVEVSLGGPGSLFDGPSAGRLIQLGAMVPPYIARTGLAPEHYQFWRLITAMFLHIGLIHLAFNMYALYLFGYLIENAFGKARYIAIYFVAGFLGNVASFAFGQAISVGAGASGAIFGLLGAWIAYNYRRRGSALAEANLRWALILIGLNTFIALSFHSIDWRAHLGGLVGGVLAGWLVEGFGPRRIQPYVQYGGLIALTLIGVALTAWRVATFPLS
jgi:membrane associated rhomboid family serine protease